MVEQLKALSSSLGFERGSVKKSLTPLEAGTMFKSDITAAKLRSALAALKLSNTGGHAVKVRKVYDYELK